MLELANARIREEYKGGRGSAATCVDRVAALFEKRGIFGFDRRSPSDRNAAVSNSVGVGIEFAEEALPGLGSKAAAISVFPENVAIPVQALSELLDMETFDVEEEVLRPLDGLSLLRWDRKHDTIHLHRMIHRALASRLAAVEGGPAAVHRRLLAAWGDSYRLPHEYAWRWFAWHCVLAHEEARLQQLLLDFHWLQTKLDVTDINALIADFAYVHDDHRIQVLERALRASAHILATRRGELATQLLARVIESDRPSLEELFCGLHADARQPWLRPLTASLAQPGLLRVFHASSDIRAVAVNSDGRLIVSVGGDNTHTVWDSESAIPLRRVNLESGTVMALSFDANRSVEVTTLSDLATVTWDVQTGIRLKSDATLLPCLPSPLSVENDSEHVEWSHLSSDPAWVVITARGRSGKWRAANDYTIYLGSADHTVRVAGRFSDYNFHTAAIASKGRHLITSSFPSGTVVRDIETGVQVAVIPGDPVKAVACSVTGDVVVTVSYSGVITVWNLESLIASRRDVARHTRPVIDVRVANGEMLGFSVSVDGTANTWNLNTGAVVFAIAPEADTAFDPDWAIMSSAIDPDKRHVHFVVCDSDFIRTGEGTVESYDLTTGATVSAATRPWPFRETPIDLGALGINTSEKPLCISPDGTRGVTASADQTIWVWDIVTGTRIASFGVDSTPISCACIERATIVLMGEESGRVHVLRLEEAAS